MLFNFCMRGCGRIERPAFPAPSGFRGKGFLANLGRIARRENAKVYPGSGSDEACAGNDVATSLGCLKIESAGTAKARSHAMRFETLDQKPNRLKPAEAGDVTRGNEGAPG